jgi:hypothetical protein
MTVDAAWATLLALGLLQTGCATVHENEAERSKIYVDREVADTKIGAALATVLSSMPEMPDVDGCVVRVKVAIEGVEENVSGYLSGSRLLREINESRFKKNLAPVDFSDLAEIQDAEIIEYVDVIEKNHPKAFSQAGIKQQFEGVVSQVEQQKTRLAKIATDNAKKMETLTADGRQQFTKWIKDKSSIVSGLAKANVPEAVSKNIVNAESKIRGLVGKNLITEDSLCISSGAINVKSAENYAILEEKLADLATSVTTTARNSKEAGEEFAAKSACVVKGWVEGNLKYPKKTAAKAWEKMKNACLTGNNLGVDRLPADEECKK